LDVRTLMRGLPSLRLCAYNSLLANLNPLGRGMPAGARMDKNVM